MNRDQLTEARSKPVHWCLVHEHIGRGPDKCIMVSYLSVQGATVADLCQMVKAVLLLDFPTAEQMVELAQVIHSAQDEHGLKTRHDIGLIVGKAIRVMLEDEEE